MLIPIDYCLFSHAIYRDYFHQSWRKFVEPAKMDAFYLANAINFEKLICGKPDIHSDQHLKIKLQSSRVLLESCQSHFLLWLTKFTMGVFVACIT